MNASPLRTACSHLRGAALGLSALGAVMLADPAAAQTGSVRINVVDEHGTAMGFVDVTLEGEQSNFTHTELADENGSVLFNAVPVGSYRVYGYLAGFEPDKLQNILVAPDSRGVYSLRLLPMERREETVVVIGKIIDLVPTRETQTSTTLTGEFLSKIPLQNKRIQDIVALFPGAVKSGSSDSSDISVGGGTGGQIGYRLNGASINDSVDGGAILDVPTAAIEGFKLTTSGFSAKYGEQSSAVAEIVTKRGRNELDFTYEVNYRDSHVGATGIPRLDDVAKFIDDTMSARGTILAGEVAAGFRLLGIDPVSTRDDDHNPPPRYRLRQTISAGGPIIRDKVFFHSTLETVADDFGSAFTDHVTKIDQTLYTGKMNWDLSEKHKFEVSLNLDVNRVANRAGYFETESTVLDSLEGTWQISALDRYIFDDRTFLETQVTATREYTALRPRDVRTGVGTGYRVPLPPGGVFVYGLGAGIVNFDQTQTQLRLDETLNKSLERHTIETGFTWQGLGFESFTEQGVSVTDFRITDDSNFLAMPGSAFVGRVADAGDPVITDDKTWAAAAFVQDKWQVTENLTLDMGLRLDYQAFVGRFFVAPRFGFSLDPIGDRKTRFYGNWGLYHDNLYANALQWIQNPILRFDDIYFANAYQARRGFSETPITEIYKEALATATNSPAPDAVAFLVKDIEDRFVLDDSLTAPTTEQWAVGLQRRLPANMTIEVTYTENKRTHQLEYPVVTRRERQFTSYEIRDRILATTGEGRYRSWTGQLTRPFSEKWEMNLSYTQGKNTGPIPPPDNPLDPRDVVSVNGTLGNDRTHVVKAQGHGKLPWKMDMNGSFTWQSGQPISAQIVTPQGFVFYPFGRNTLRLPSTRQLDFGLRRPFQTQDGKLNVTAQLQFFNILNTLNVFSGLGRFDLPPGATDPQDFPPLRPKVIPDGVDVSRSLELGLTIAF